ncbi:ABC transporter substrate-binding protein [Brachybacterium sacelli]|uniref:Iron complex transport system substrate-binding protein n=1 Tax=Brachybacterium sacelli TaxID=173364 RepID=A0ABS4X2A0_9MICO|nr:ABC transporter substrate-binding protein [Brachybacterium sacelli]MBP2382562.1 iron complex transport system substrate-binding protein [Brachybacterium sacelli]
MTVPHRSRSITAPLRDGLAPSSVLDRRSLLAGAGLLGLTTLSACGAGEAGTLTSGSDDDSDLRTVTDAMGREVELPLQPRAVVSLHYAGTQAMMDLGVIPVGTGAAGQSGEDGLEYVPENLWTDLQEVPVVVPGGEVDIEAVAGLEPDLVLAHNVLEDDVLSQLEQIAPVFGFTLRGGDRADWQQRVHEVAEALGLGQEFTDLKSAWEDELATTAEEYADVTDGLVVGVIGAYETGNFYAWGEENMPGTLLTPLGLTWSAQENQAVAGQGEPEATISSERILEVVGDADLLFYDSNLLGEPNSFMVELQESSLYQQLEAVKAGRVHAFGKNTIAGFSDARFSLEQIRGALEDFRSS